ncbi:Zn(2)-C6 fungal-type domain-containing protein [Fusarium sp. LHS14.1]|nr:Zn(2)-C6 fungal-type domain-containing protein [Fusarium sp. LHS14.1]
MEPRPSTHSPATKARLRTKTGCSTCRQRRIKCGEEKPACRNCISASRGCVWPGPEELDRRLRKFREQLYPKATAATKPTVTNVTPLSPTLLPTDLFSLAELDLIHHWLNVLSDLLVLPNADPACVAGHSFETLRMMTSCSGLKSAILACSASNKSTLSKDPRYQVASLRYYNEAIRYVSDAVADIGHRSKAPSDMLITTMTYVYAYDLWGPDGELDARKHVAAAITLMKIRYQTAPKQICDSPTASWWYRVVYESVLYQAFFLAIRKPLSPDFDVDPELFQLQNEYQHLKSFATVLERQPLILGLPLSLYSLMIAVIKTPQLPEAQRRSQLLELRTELALWETLTDDDTPNLDVHSGFQANAVALFVLATSLLLDQMCEQCLPAGNPAELTTTSHTRWQVFAALRLLQRPDVSEMWTRCYLGAWPVLVVGYSAREEEHISSIRSILRQMAERTGYGEFQRILEELEDLWARKQ